MSTNTTLRFMLTSTWNGTGTDEAANAISNVGSTMDRTGAAMVKVGGTLTQRLTLPIVGMGMAVVSAAGDFEQSMKTVQAVSGATGEQFDELSQLAQKLGRETKFTAGDAADAMTFLAMAGFEVNDIIGAIPGTLNLAAAGAVDLATAADLSTNILAGYGMEVDQLDHAIDVLAATFTNANTDMQQLGDAFKYAGPVAKGAGIQFEEAAAAIGLMGNAGIQGTMAGTSLRGAITRLLAPTNQIQKVLDKLGVTVTNSAGEMLPLVNIIEQLEDAGASTADMMTLFGQRAGPAMAAVMSQGSDALRDFTTLLEDSGGTAESVATIQMEGMKGAWIELKSAAEGLMIAIGESGLLQALENVMDKATGYTRAFAAASPETLKFITTLLGIAAAIGPALLVAGWLARLAGVVLKLVAAGKVLATFMRVALIPTIYQLGIALMTTPVGWIIMAVVAIIAVFVLLWTKCEWFRNFWIATWDLISGAVVTAWDWIYAAVGTAVDWIVNTLGTVWDTVVAATVAAWEWIVEAIGTAWNWIQSTAETVWAAIGDAVTTSIDVISSAISSVVNFLVTVFGPVWETLKEAADSFWGWIGERVTEAEATIGPIIDGIKERVALFAPVWEWLSDVIGSAVSFISDTVSTHFGYISDGISVAWEWISGVFGPAWDILWTHLSASFSVAITVVTALWDAFVWAIDNGSTIVMAVLDFLAPAFQVFWNILVILFEVAIDAIGFMWDVWLNSMSFAWDAFVALIDIGVQALSIAWDIFVWTIEFAFTAALAIIDAVFMIIFALFDTAVAGIKVLGEAWEWLKGATETAWNAISSAIETAWEFIWMIIGPAVKMVTNAIEAAWNWISEATETAWNAVSDAVETVMRGLQKIIRDQIDAIKRAFTSVKNAITGFFKGAGKWLWDAGKEIIGGLIGGIKNMMPDLGGVVGGIGNFIKGLKGPIEYDRVMLIPEGQAIMGGLMKGIGSKMPALGDQVSSIGPMIKSEVSTDLSAPALLASDGASSGGGDNIFNFDGAIIAGGPREIEDLLVAALRNIKRDGRMP